MQYESYRNSYPFPILMRIQNFNITTAKATPLMTFNSKCIFGELPLFACTFTPMHCTFIQSICSFHFYSLQFVDEIPPLIKLLDEKSSITLFHLSPTPFVTLITSWGTRIKSNIFKIVVGSAFEN